MQTAPAVFYEDTARHRTLATHKQAVECAIQVMHTHMHDKPTGRPPERGFWGSRSRPAFTASDRSTPGDGIALAVIQQEAVPGTGVPRLERAVSSHFSPVS